MRLVGVYDANGGIAGELAYILGHMVGLRDCALCDITHSPVAKKARWKALETELAAEGIEFALVHKNERSAAELLASDGQEPCVLVELPGGDYHVLLGSVELSELDGSVDAFAALLRERLARR